MSMMWYLVRETQEVHGAVCRGYGGGQDKQNTALTVENTLNAQIDWTVFVVQQKKLARFVQQQTAAAREC